VSVRRLELGLLQLLAWCAVHRDAGGAWRVVVRRRATHWNTGGKRDAARRVAATRRATNRDTGGRRDATVSRRVAGGRCWRCRVVPPSYRVGGGDDDTICR
jgi:hypothetical protein